jgi:predicted MFS family arabinose efflux permease
MQKTAAPTIEDRGPAAGAGQVAGGLIRFCIIALTAFLTVVDLFAVQALLPSLVHRYGVSPAAMSLAVNACTLGMAAAGLGVALVRRPIDQRLGILVSLAALSLPTALLAVAPGLATFAALRVLQGIFMATAFSLTLGYLGERYSERGAASAFAAYITGNVASNLIGRLIAAATAGSAGLEAAFLVFAALNLAGAALVYFTVTRVPRMAPVSGEAMRPMAAWPVHLANPALRAGFGIGFCILFAFIGTFTFVNFVLIAPPLSVGMMQLGVIYLVFLPSIVTTPFAGVLGSRLGTRGGLLVSLGVAALALPLLVSGSLTLVLAGMVLMGVGTFAAQALATGFVSRTATSDRGAASGIYLASYFVGGLAGTAALGQLFDAFGWPATVAGIGASLAVAALLTARIDPAPQPSTKS